jgi:methyl-accepting chemotaxis protein
MERFSSFDRRVIIVFVGAVFFSLLIGRSALYALRTVLASKNAALYEYSDELISVEQLRVLAERVVASGRGYLISQDESYRRKMEETHQKFEEIFRQVEGREVHASDRALLQTIRATDLAYQRQLRAILAQRHEGKTIRELVEEFENGVQPARDAFEEALSHYASLKREELERAKKESERATRDSMLVFGLSGGISFVLLFFAFVEQPPHPRTARLRSADRV